ncbi:Nitroreductase family protein [Candidatus Norongarragalina meridionalis]|nr:Nitroreductase family protein [Candidatus Norongarragalina meridionalis]
METEKAILGRRAVRDYERKAVPDGVIGKILKAGAMAPSAMDRQPCRFVVITNREKMAELSGKVKEKAGLLGFGMRLAERAKLKEDVIFYGAPLLILIVAENGKWAALDCALAAQNMMLRAYDLGLGSCFIGFARFLGDDRETLRSLGIKDSQDLYCPLIFGYPKKWPAPKSREANVQKTIG